MGRIVFWCEVCAVVIAAFLPQSSSAGDLELSDALQISVGFNEDGRPAAPRALDGIHPGSAEPLFSPDASVLVFTSGAVNLVAGLHFEGNSSRSPNVFMRQGESVELVSKNIYGKFPTRLGDGIDLITGATTPSVSRVIEGKFAVAFTSDAEDLVVDYQRPSTSEPNPRQVYLHLPSRNETVLVSGRYDNTTARGANNHSDQPTVALVGEDSAGALVFRVAFRSLASDLGIQQTTSYNSIVYWREITVPMSGPIVIEEIKKIQTASTDCEMGEPAISPDGHKLAFASSGTVLTGVVSTLAQIYSSDLLT
jgi:hypothetical protein